MRILTRVTVPAALSLAILSGAARAEIIDPVGDFLPSFAGPASAELDVIRANATYDGTSFVLSSVEAGPISTTSNALFVWGFDRGAGTARFGALATGVLFDSVVAINPTAGTVAVNDLVGGRPAASLGSGALQVIGNTLSVTVPAALLPSQGLAPDAYLVNLWPRTGAGNNNQIADFAPDNSDFQVTRVAAVPVPEPASAALLATGLLGLMAVQRRR